MCVLRLHAITSRSMGKQKEIKVPKKFETQAASSMVLTKTRTYFLVGLSLRFCMSIEVAVNRIRFHIFTMR